MPSLDLTVSIIAKADSLNKMAWELRRKDTTKALLLAQEALELSLNYDYPFGEGKALKRIGVIKYYQNRYLQALKHYKEALSVFQGISDTEEQAMTYFMIGNVYEKDAKIDLALKVYLQGYKIAEKEQLTTALPLFYTALAGFYYNYLEDEQMAMSFYRKAILFHQKAVKQTQDDEQTKNDERNKKGVAYYHYAIFLDRISLADSALVYSEEAEAIFRSLKEENRLSAVLNLRGIILYRQRKLAEALGAYLSCRQLKEAKKDTNGLLGLIINISTIYQAQKNMIWLWQNWKRLK